MNYIFNRKEMLERRRYLRNHATRAERMLWERLKGKGLSEYKFRRQHSIGHYILDFYCPELKLAIEVDGESHDNEKAKIYDKEREDEIKTYGIRFFRIKNEMIYNNLDLAVKNIEDFIKTIRNEHTNKTPLSNIPDNYQ
jgi:very-short-patch-repair endonuclease